MVISNFELQQLYINLYKALRRYIWPFPVVKHIAEIEIQSYTAFPDLKQLKMSTSALRSACRSIISSDEDLEIALSEFEDFVDDGQTYVKLNKLAIMED